MQNSKSLFIALIVIAALSRLMPHPDNFTAMGAVALFAGSTLRRYSALLIPVLALFLSDLLINNIIYNTGGFTLFTSGFAYFAGAYVLIALLGRTLQRQSTGSVLAYSIVSALVFFIISNFGVWISGVMYPKTTAGLLMAYEMAIPFLRNDIIGTAIFSVAIFGAFNWLKERNAIRA